MSTTREKITKLEIQFQKADQNYVKAVRRLEAKELRKDEIQLENGTADKERRKELDDELVKVLISINIARSAVLFLMG